MQLNRRKTPQTAHLRTAKAVVLLDQARAVCRPHRTHHRQAARLLLPPRIPIRLRQAQQALLFLVANLLPQDQKASSCLSSQLPRAARYCTKYACDGTLNSSPCSCKHYRCCCKISYAALKTSSPKQGSRFANARGIAAGVGSLAKSGAQSAAMSVPSGAAGTIVTDPNATGKQILTNTATAAGIGFVSPTAFAGAGYAGKQASKGAVKSAKVVDRQAQAASKRFSQDVNARAAQSKVDAMYTDARARTVRANKLNLPASHPERKAINKITADADQMQLSVPGYAKRNTLQKVTDRFFTGGGLSTARVTDDNFANSQGRAFAKNADILSGSMANKKHTKTPIQDSTQGGVAASSKNVSLPSSVAPGAEARIFTHNPLSIENAQSIQKIKG